MMSLVRICLLVVVGTVGVTWGQKIPRPPPWGFQTYIGSAIELDCNSSEGAVQEGDSLVWQSPKGVDIINDEKFMLKDADNVRSMFLKVHDVTDDDKGVYLCKIYRNNIFQIKVNRGINIYEPLYRNKFDKYRHWVMVGGIAAAAMFVPLVFMCFVYKFRFKTDEQRQDAKEAEMIRKTHFMYSSDSEAGELPAKNYPDNGIDGIVNEGYVNTKL